MDDEMIVLIREFIYSLAELCIPVAAGIIVYYIRKWANNLQQKTECECVDEYIKMIEAVIADCVMATNQTYVDAAKNRELFDKEGQVTAFQKSKNNILSILSDAQKELITKVFGDVETWLDVKIESEVKKQKGEDKKKEEPIVVAQE